MLKALVILTPGFPKDEDDTTCVPAQQLFVKTLKETHPGLKIIVITFHYPHYTAKYDWHDVKVLAVGSKKKGPIFRRVEWFRAWSVLKHLNGKYRLIGLLSFWMGECAWIGDMFGRKYFVKHYCWLLGQDAKAGNKYFKKIAPKGEELIALSDFIVSEFHNNYGVAPKHIIPVGIDPSLFKPTVAERTIDIIGAGALIPLKQYDVFIDIIAYLKDIFPDINAIICGKGPELKNLTAKIEMLNLEKNLTLTGELPHKEVLALMQRSKIFLHTSNYEGFGLVCLEALYAGTKVVSFVRPMNERITNWYVAPHKHNMLRIITEILRDKNIGHQHILPFALEDNARAMVKLFDYKEPAMI